MSTSDWFVVLGGVAAIAWVNWYFFLARRGSATAETTQGGGLRGRYLDLFLISFLILFFGAYMLVDGIFAIVAAVRAAREEARWGLMLLEGILGVVVGLVALVGVGP